MRRLFFTVVLSMAASIASASSLTQFDFQGNAGFGLLPDNEIGANTSLGSASTAIGGVTGGGIVYNDDTNELSIEFSFENLGGLFTNAASGIHLHEADASDPFNTNGGIVFNLNSFALDGVFNDNGPLADGVSEGTVSALITLTEDEEDTLFSGAYYLNIHSATFTGGELRGNLVAVPEPATISLVGLLGGVAACGLRRRK